MLSPERYNAMRGVMICCPMTSRIKGYLVEVVVTQSPPSAVLAHQVKSLDWRARRAARKGAVSPHIPADVQAKIEDLLARRLQEICVFAGWYKEFNGRA